MNIQRMVIYEQRRHVLEGADLSEEIGGWMDEVVAQIVYEHTESEYQEEWDLDSLFARCRRSTRPRSRPRRSGETTTREELIEEFQDDARDAYDAKVEEYGAELMREVERYLVLQVVDVRWREHLESMEYLRDGIHLRAMAQKDPLSEYRSEGHGMFEELTATIQEEVVRYLLRIQIEKPPEQGELEPAAAGPNGGPNGDGLSYEHESVAGSDAIRAAGAAEAARGGAGAVATAGGGRRGGDDRLDGSARGLRGGAGRPQRPVPVRLRQEVQEVPRRLAPRACAGQPRTLRSRPWPSAARSSESSRRSGPSWPGSVITFDPDGLRERLAALEEAMGAPGFWDDQEEAARVSSEHARLSRRLERYEQLSGEAADLAELLELASDDGELDEIEQSARRPAGAARPPAGGLALQRRVRRAATRSSRSTPARAARTRRTGPRSSSACTSAGRPTAASRPS